MEDPSRCCDVLHNHRHFASLQITNNEDMLSNLPDDCLINVFAFLNHDDLDVMSQVSQKMRNVAIYMRAKTIRRRAECLSISQYSNGVTVVTLRRKNTKKNFIMRLKCENNGKMQIKCGKYTGFPPRETGKCASDDFDTRPRTPCFLYERIRYLTGRFSISTLCLSNIRIDLNSVEHWVNAIPYLSIRQIEISGLEFERGFGINEYKRFMSWLASKNPHQVRIHGNVLSIYASELFESADSSDIPFIDQIMANGNCRKLHLYFGQELRFPMPQSCYREIAKFENYYLQNLVIDVNCLIDIVLKRLVLEVKGTFMFSTEANVDWNQVLTSIGEREVHVSYLVGSVEGHRIVLKPHHLDSTATLFVSHNKKFPAISVFF